MVTKVLFVQSSHVWDAIASTHAQLMRTLDRQRFEVHVACTPRPSPKGGPSVLERINAIPDLRVHVVDFGPSFHGPTKSDQMDVLRSLPRLPLGLLSLFSYMKHESIDLVHIGPKPRDVYGLVFAKALGIKCVFHIHFLYGEWIPATVKWAMRHSDFVVGISAFSANSVVQIAQVPAHKVDFVFNTLEISDWNPDFDGSGIRREFGIGARAPLLGIVARLIEWKGHAVLLEAMAIVARDVPEARLLIVGDEAPQAQGRVGYGEELKAKASALGVDKAVIFAGFRRDIQAVMASLDIFVFPAWEEGFGMVLLEAMAMKKPVIAWNNGGPGEVVVDGETGFLVEPKNPQALADAILQLLKDAPLRQRFGAAGRARTERTFASADASHKLGLIYERCLAGSATPMHEESTGT